LLRFGNTRAFTSRSNIFSSSAIAALVVDIIGSFKDKIWPSHGRSIHRRENSRFKYDPFHKLL
jgi:hypothetical protein